MAVSLCSTYACPKCIRSCSRVTWSCNRRTWSWNRNESKWGSEEISGRKYTLLDLQMTMQVLPRLESLNESLQSASMAASGMIDAVECELKRRRSETWFNMLLARVNDSIEELELEPLRVPRQKKVPARFTGNSAAHHATSVEDYFRLLYWVKWVNAVQKLETRCQMIWRHTHPLNPFFFL